MLGAMSKQVLTESPVNLTLEESRWDVEIGWDVEKDCFTLKVFGIPYESFQRLVCRQKIENNFQGLIK